MNTGIFGATAPLMYIPTTAGNLADKVESGGSKLEDALANANVKFHTIYLFACLVVLSISFGTLMSEICRFRIANSINALFVAIIALLVGTQDLPGNPRWAGNARLLIRKNFKFTTRLMGKAICYIFLADQTLNLLWPRDSTQNGKILVALLISTLIALVGSVGAIIAYRKSRKLERLRQLVLQSAAHGTSISDLYYTYAKRDQLHGLQFEEFNRLASELSGGQITFSLTELGIIYNALDEMQKRALLESELTDWIKGPITLL